MQFSTLFSTAILAAIVSAAPITLVPASIPVSLVVSSTNEEINQLAITAVHEGAGINYMQIGNATQTPNYLFDQTNGIIFTEIVSDDSEDYRLALSSVPDYGSYTGFPYLQFSVFNPNIIWSRGEDGKLVASTGDKFYAAKNTNDPYNYSEKYFLAGVGNAAIFGDKVTDLIEIDIIVNELVQ